MRTTVLIASVILSNLFSAAAVAAPIVITHMRIATGSAPAPPAPIVLQAFPFFVPPSARISLIIPDLPADPVDRILNYDPNDGLSRSWEITEADAASYGFDWDGFAAALNGEEARIAFGLGTAGFSKSPWSGPGTLAGFQLDRIEIDMEYYFWHPILPGLRAYRIDARVFGEARIVPEPSAWLLAVWGACAAGFMGSRKIYIKRARGVVIVAQTPERRVQGVALPLARRG